MLQDKDYYRDMSQYEQLLLSVNLSRKEECAGVGVFPGGIGRKPTPALFWGMGGDSLEFWFGGIPTYQWVTARRDQIPARAV